MDFDKEIVFDFLDEFEDAQIEIEQIIKQSDGNISQEELKAIFRLIHTLKGNFFMMRLPSLGEAIHALEDVLSLVRDSNREFPPGLLILISVTLEQYKQISKQIFIGEDKADVIEKLTQVYIELKRTKPADFRTVLLSTLKLIDEMGEYGNDYSSLPLIDFLRESEKKVSIKEKPQKKSKSKPRLVTQPSAIVAPQFEPGDELEFFYQLITQIESYFPFWKGRSDKIYKLVSQMNEVYGYPVEIRQLQAAVYLHDLGMSFIPPQRIFVDKSLKEQDREIMHSHCLLGYQWLNLIPGWNEAATMVLQHHERYDGTGYPEKLMEKEICDGAKLLAIGDVFASITGQDKKGSQSRPIMFAVAEINQGSGLQFDPDWVEVFNQVIRNQK